MDVHLDVDCGCCGDACSSQCQYQSGTATLVGHAEFGTPSVPPLLYRRMEAGGVVDATVNSYNPWVDGDIHTSHSYGWYNHSGQTGASAIETTDKNTGVTTRNSYVHQLSCSTCGVGSCGGGDQGGTHLPEIRPSTTADSGFVITKDTQTEINFIAQVGCKVYHGIYNEAWDEIVANSGMGYERLSDPDTESDAEARAKAAITTWSHLEGYSCLNLASFRTARGNTFSWSWTQVQRRGITPDYDATMATQAVYRVVLKWYTTATNANGAVVSEGLVELTHSPGWVGDIYTEWADIPIPEAGLFAYAGECRISLVSAGVPRPPNPEET